MKKRRVYKNLGDISFDATALTEIGGAAIGRDPLRELTELDAQNAL